MSGFPDFPSAPGFPDASSYNGQVFQQATYPPPNAPPSPHDVPPSPLGFANPYERTISVTRTIPESQFPTLLIPFTLDRCRFQIMRHFRHVPNQSLYWDLLIRMGLDNGHNDRPLSREPSLSRGTSLSHSLHQSMYPPPNSIPPSPHSPSSLGFDNLSLSRGPSLSRVPSQSRVPSPSLHQSLYPPPNSMPPSPHSPSSLGFDNLYDVIVSGQDCLFVTRTISVARTVSVAGTISIARTISKPESGWKSVSSTIKVHFSHFCYNMSALPFRSYPHSPHDGMSPPPFGSSYPGQNPSPTPNMFIHPTPQPVPPPYSVMPASAAPESAMPMPSAQPSFPNPTPGQEYLYLGTIVPPSGSEMLPPNVIQSIMNPRFNVSATLNECVQAMKGMSVLTSLNGKYDKQLTNAIAPLSAFEIELLKKSYETSRGEWKETGDLIQKVNSKTSGDYGIAIEGKIRGPILFDCWLLKRACKGMGTDESVLTEVLLNRTNDEIKRLKETFQVAYNQDLEQVVADDLSSRANDIFVMALAGTRGTIGTDGGDGKSIDRNKVDKDIEILHQTRKGSNEIKFCRILVTSGNEYLRDVILGYGIKYGKLSYAIKDKFSGHVKDALLHIARYYEDNDDGVARDAELIEDSMKGLGTDEFRLTYRILRAHWDKERFSQIKAKYERVQGQTLNTRIRGETSRSYRDFLIQIII
ncbi:hypothetical protein M422DRAFT_45133 [Sphaerobolus stellatus SS14]|nr:hypothetical protein M422DRAFT_45133 [Sphaerobolus stellatus SS14]